MKETHTCDDRDSRKTFARAVFMVMMSARVFLPIACVALTVALVIVCALCVVGHIQHNGWKRCKSIWV